MIGRDRGWLLAAILVLQACSINRYQLGEPLAAWESDQARGTSLDAALAQLGPPLHISAQAQGYLLAWEYWEINEEKLGLSLRALGADFLSVDFGDAETRGEFLVLSFDREHRVVDSRFQRWRADAGSGQGVQALVSVISVVDVDDLTHRLLQHRWGAFNLAPLAVGLNRQQDLSTGENGLQRRGTPTRAGQHSTQMGRGDQ